MILFADMMVGFVVLRDFDVAVVSIVPSAADVLTARDRDSVAVALNRSVP